MSQTPSKLPTSEEECTLPNRADTHSKKKWYFLISNPTKSNHLGTLLRCAAAFNVHQVLLVGYDKFNSQGSFGSHSFLDILAFHSWDTVVGYLRSGGDEGDNDGKCKNNDGQMNNSECCKNEKNKVKDEKPNSRIKIIGILGGYGGGEDLYSPDGMPVYENSDTGYVTLTPPNENNEADKQNNETNGNNECNQSENIPLPARSLPAHLRRFSSDVCFIVSKDKRGFPISQAKLCDGFVHVPHLSVDASIAGESVQAKNTTISATSLLDTATTFSIVLHHFTAWAQYTERSFLENQKFEKDDRPDKGRGGYGMVRYYKGTNEDANQEKVEEGINSEEEEENALLVTNLWKGMGEKSSSSDY